GAEDGDGESLAAVELPIQESIDVAIPLSAVYAVCTQFEDFPQFLDRVESVERQGDGQLQVVAKVGGSVRELAIEVMDERPDERLDWACEEGYEHSGVISLHPLAPRLTRLELTVERQPESVAERLARRLGLPQRTIQEELRRFKAYAELWEEADEAEPADVPVPEDEAEPEEEEEPAEEEEEEEVPEEEEEEVPEEELTDEEPAEPVQTSD
ncbi:MAG: SRPBCC family protein, partial [Solirubrobacterales bacterium]